LRRYSPIIPALIQNIPPRRNTVRSIVNGEVVVVTVGDVVVRVVVVVAELLDVVVVVEVVASVS
jgi:hypothetical protein